MVGDFVPRSALAVLGVGTYLPPVREVVDDAVAAGVDLTPYRGWPRYCAAAGDDHPSTMGASAVRVALEQAKRSAKELRLVVFVGMSRDYVPSWSASTEVMRLVDAPIACHGVDLTAGCLGALEGLDLVQAWMGSSEQGCAAIVASERWSDTVSRSNASSLDLWGYADGASAVIVGSTSARDARSYFRGSAFISNAAWNGMILVKYGGTRFPTAPPDESSFARRMGPQTRAEIYKTYVAHYTRIFATLSERFPGSPDQLVCNQISPTMVRAIAETARIDASRVCDTGSSYGHVGSADLFIGLARLAEQDALRKTTWLGASTPYAFGAGVLTEGP